MQCRNRQPTPEVPHSVCMFPCTQLMGTSRHNQSTGMCAFDVHRSCLITHPFVPFSQTLELTRLSLQGVFRLLNSMSKIRPQVRSQSSWVSSGVPFSQNPQGAPGPSPVPLQYRQTSGALLIRSPRLLHNSSQSSTSSSRVSSVPSLPTDVQTESRPRPLPARVLASSSFG